MIPTSIRWRLPLSYVVIALLATLVLGVVLVTTLRGYYAQREFEHLQGNALAISRTLADMYNYKLSDKEIQPQLQSLAFLSQTRIRLMNPDGTILADSGDGKEPRTIALTYTREAPPPDVVYQIYKPGLPSVTGQIVDNQGGASVSVIDMAPHFIQAPLPPLDEAEVNRRWFLDVAGTPYGFGLNVDRDISTQQRSDQQVKTPLYNTSNQLIGYVELSDGPAYGTEIVDGIARGLIGAGFVAVMLAVGVGWLISRYISSPLLLLADATHRMADGNLAVRVSVRREDEFGLLADSFNHMASRVENTVVTLRRFVADAAHELHTPITALHANLELAATDEDHAQRLTFVQRAQEQLKRLETMTNGLLDLSRIEAGDVADERTPVDMNTLVLEVSELYASRAEQACLSFQVDAPDESIIANVHEAQLRRVIANLLDNAIKFTPENGVIYVGLRREAKGVKLWVQDTGIGIPSEDMQYLFNRFRRGRNAAAYPGSGLGLAIIKAIVEGHGGQVTVESSPKGTCFYLLLPAGT